MVKPCALLQLPRVRDELVGGAHLALAVFGFG